MYLTRRAELAEAAALISPLELPPTMRSAAAAPFPARPPPEFYGRGRHTSAASIAGSTLPPHVINLIAGNACLRQLMVRHWAETLLCIPVHAHRQQPENAPACVLACSIGCCKHHRNCRLLLQFACAMPPTGDIC